VIDNSDGSGDDPTHTLIHIAIKEQDFDEVNRLISMSYDVNTCCPCGCGISHLALAVGSANAKVVSLLIAHKADVNASGKTESSGGATTPLHIACAVTSYDVAKVLIECRADVNARCSLDGATPMHVNACFNVNMDKSMGDGKYLIDQSQRIQTLLISSKANIDAQNAAGQTPLHVAIRHGVTTMQCFLIRNGADLNIFDKEKRNALIYAVSHGSSSTTALLLANRAPVPQFKVPLVCRAASRNGWSIVMQLLNNGADINDTDDRGNNAIHYALTAVDGSDNCCRETHIIEKLIARGCNPCHANRAGITPLQAVMKPGPKYEPSHAEFILLEYVIGSMYTFVYGTTPISAKDMAALMHTSWRSEDVELLFKIKSGTPAYRTTPRQNLLYDLHRMRKALVSDKNAKEILESEPQAKNGRQRRSDRKADELKLRAAKATFLQALLRRSFAPCFSHSNTKECVVCFGLCSTSKLPVLAPCGHRTVCSGCVPSIKGVCPSCCQPVLCVVPKIYD
jgi:ankyrin repeat protein